MSEFDQKIQTLSQEIAAAKAKVNHTLRNSVIFYIVIIIGVTAYTLYLSNRIQQLATPETVAELIGNTVKTKMPQIQQRLVQEAKVQAPILARKTVDLGEKMLPQAEILVKTKIDAGITAIIDHTVNAALPVLVDRLKTSFDAISQHKNLIADKKTAENIADLLSTQIADELDKVINLSFYDGLTKLQSDIDAIAQKAPGKLTQRELAEKRVIVYWLYLIDKAEPGESPFVELLRFIPEYKFGKN